MSLVTIPITVDPLLATRRLRKALRDVRDRQARIDPAWAAVAMGGMLNGDHLLMVIQHHGIERDTLWATLERRWPNVMMTVPGSIEPNSVVMVDTAVALACARRGIEPIRAVVPAQSAALSSSTAGWDQPMPVLV